MKMEIEGFTEFVLTLQEIANTPQEVMNNMLNEAGRITVEEQKRAIMEMGLVDTHEMINSIAKARPKRTDDGGSIVVRPRGTDSKGVRNAEKLFLAEFGFKTKAGRLVIKLSNDRALPKIHKRLYEIYGQFVNKVWQK